MKLIIVAGENGFPSNVLGQGRTNQTKVLLSNMVPDTQYEIIVMSGSGDTQSIPSSVTRFTSELQDIVL